MNQILDYNPNKTTKSGSSGSDKVVRVFAVILAIFAICLLGLGGYSLLKNKKADQEIIANNDTKAEITVEQQDESLHVKVVYDRALKNIVYLWDSDNKETNLSCNNQTEFETDIKLIAGEHALTISAMDVDNNTVGTYTQTFTSEFGEDKEKPTIEIKQEQGLDYITVIATDETEMDFVTYRWNNDDEIKVEAEEGAKEIRFNIDILQGTNDLIIIAIDKNQNNASEELNFIGLLEPEIKYEISPERDSVLVKVSHDAGLKEIKLFVNGQDYSESINIGDDAPTYIDFTLQLQGERNLVKVEAYSVDNTQSSKEEEIIKEPEVVEEPEDNVEISVLRDEGNNKLVNVNIKSPEGIKEIGLNINDVDYQLDLGETVPEERQDISFQLELQPGNNRITIKVVKPNDEEKIETTEEYYEE